jgi:hypothetical protein
MKLILETLAIHYSYVAVKLAVCINVELSMSYISNTPSE